jgi:Flp pilus assembly protein TadD
VTLADLLIQKGEREEAASLLRRALQLNPSDEQAKILWQRLNP